MPLPHALFRTLALVALTGATAARAETAAEADLRIAASWCASAARVARGWHDGSLPDRYTARTLGIAEDELAKLDRSLAREGDASRHATFVEAIDAVRQLADAVRRHDAASTAIATLPPVLEARARLLAPPR